MFPRPVGCRRGATAGPWHRPQWTTPVDSHTLAPVQADRARQHEQARSVLRQARAASAEEAVSSLPPEVHAARRPLEPDMSRVPENRENRLMRPGPPRNPMRETAAPRKTSRPNVISPTDYSGVVATDLRPSSDCRVSVRHSRQTRDCRDWFPRGGSAARPPRIRFASGQSPRSAQNRATSLRSSGSGLPLGTVMREQGLMPIHLASTGQARRCRWVRDRAGGDSRGSLARIRTRHDRGGSVVENEHWCRRC